MTNSNHITELLTRGVTEVIAAPHLAERMRSGVPLRVKFGVDPTSPHIHLGRMVPILKLRDFQRLGHTIIIIIGNATGVIGDTSDKESERPMLTPECVAENMAAYKEQIGKILDMNTVEFVYNAEWLNKLSFAQIGDLANQFSVHDFIVRENIKKRLDAGKRVSLREVLYPLMQGYDSVAVRADVEVGGTDQRFNLLAGRTLQEHAGQIPQDVVMTEIIPGTDGRKMSSSWGNTIAVTDDPRTMYGKVMRIPDPLIIPYMTCVTRIPLADIATYRIAMQEGTNPRDYKMILAREIVTLLWGSSAARTEEQFFITTFSERQAPSDAPEVVLQAGEMLTAFLVRAACATSNGDARRKIEQGGVDIAGTTIMDVQYLLTEKDRGCTVKIGKRQWRTIV